MLHEVSASFSFQMTKTLSVPNDDNCHIRSSLTTDNFSKPHDLLLIAEDRKTNCAHIPKSGKHMSYGILTSRTFARAQVESRLFRVHQLDLRSPCRVTRECAKPLGIPCDH